MKENLEKILKQGLEKIEKAPMVKPSDAILNQFHRIAEPLLRKAELLDQENKKLAEARDRLLPKLMSGEIEV